MKLNAIHTVLKDTYLSPPQSKEEWLEVSSKFEEIWNVSQVTECLDGKHIRIERLKLSGTLYLKYKGFLSRLLPQYVTRITALFCLGNFWSNNDSGVLASSQIGEMFEDELLHVSEDRKLNDSDNENLPIFCLKMKFPY